MGYPYPEHRTLHSPEHYGIAVKALLDDPNIDSVLVNFVTPFFVDCDGVAREIAKLAKNATKPIVGIVITDKFSWASTLEILHSASIPTYAFPETGARALIAMTKYAALMERPDEVPPEFKDAGVLHGTEGD